MISLGIILLLCGAIGAVACHLATIPVGVRIGFFTAIFGLILILLGYLLPHLDATRSPDVDATSAFTAYTD